MKKIILLITVLLIMITTIGCSSDDDAANGDLYEPTPTAAATAAPTPIPAVQPPQAEATPQINFFIDGWQLDFSHGARGSEPIPIVLDGVTYVPLCRLTEIIRNFTVTYFSPYRVDIEVVTGFGMSGGGSSQVAMAIDHPELPLFLANQYIISGWLDGSWVVPIVGAMYTGWGINDITDVYIDGNTITFTLCFYVDDAHPIGRWSGTQTLTFEKIFTHTGSGHNVFRLHREW